MPDPTAGKQYCCTRVMQGLDLSRNVLDDTVMIGKLGIMEGFVHHSSEGTNWEKQAKCGFWSDQRSGKEIAAGADAGGGNDTV